MFLLISVALALFILARCQTASQPNAFCKSQVTSQMQVHSLFVSSLCIYFRVTSFQANQNVQNEKLYESCLANKSLPTLASRQSISSIFQGLVKQVDSAVQIPIKDLSLQPNEANVSLSAQSVVITFANGGHFDCMLLTHVNRTFVAAPAVLVRQVKTILRPLLDSAIVSIAYDSNNRRLYVLLASDTPARRFALFDVANRNLKYVQLALQPHSRLNATRVHSVIYANKCIFLGDDTHVYQIEEMNDTFSHTAVFPWKQYFGCNGTSPLSPPMSVTTSNSTSLQMSNHKPDSLSNTIKVVIIVFIIILIIFIIAICYYFIRAIYEIFNANQNPVQVNDGDSMESMFNDCSHLPRTIYDKESPVKIRQSRHSAKSGTSVGFFFRRKKPQKRRSSTKRVSANRLTSTPGDYSSILSFFNSSKLNMSKTYQGRRSALHVSSVKTIPISSESTDSSESLEAPSLTRTIESQPSLEYSAKRVFKAGYFVEDTAKPGGFKMKFKETVEDDSKNYRK